MSSMKLSGKGAACSPGHITWTKEMKTTLHLLNTEFDFNSHQIEAVFKVLYKDDLEKCGRLDSDIRSTLQSQYRSRSDERWPPRWRMWQEVCGTNQTPEDAERRQAILLRIKETVQYTNTDTRAPSSNKRKRGVEPHAIAGPSMRPGTPLSKLPPIAAWKSVIPDSVEEQEGHSAAEDTVVLSPKRVKRTSRALLPKFPYPRPDDKKRGLPPRMLTYEEHQLAKQPLVTIPKEHACPPLTPLFLRYWAEVPSDTDHNSREKFLSRRHCLRSHIPSPRPNYSSIDTVDIVNHFDRTEEPSPFISVSNALWWTFRYVGKIVTGKTKEQYSDEYKRNIRITVIDSRALDPQLVYHALPYYLQTRKKFPYHDGAQRPVSEHEFLVWRGIPAKAIIHTFNYDDLLSLTQSVPSLQAGLRWEILCENINFKKKAIKKLREQNIQLSPELTAAIAKLANFIGVGPRASSPQISHVVADFIQGFGIQLQIRTRQQWAALASIFEMSLLISSGSLDMPRDQNIKKAFLDGVRLGHSSNWNTLLDVKRMRAMHKKAKKIGLGDTAQVLCDEMDAAKLHLRLDEDRFRRALQGRDVLALEMATEAESAGEESDSGDDFQAVFEMDEDGRIV